jgi:hypothetical protein
MNSFEGIRLERATLASPPRAPAPPLLSTSPSSDAPANLSSPASAPPTFAPRLLSTSPAELPPSARNGEARNGEALPGPSTAIKQSDWNRGNTWESTDVTLWAKTRLTELLKACSCVDENARVSVTDVPSVKGAASVPIVRGRKRYMFDFCVALDFVSEPADADAERGAGGVRARGRLTVPELCSDGIEALSSEDGESVDGSCALLPPSAEDAKGDGQKPPASRDARAAEARRASRRLLVAVTEATRAFFEEFRKR